MKKDKELARRLSRICCSTFFLLLFSFCTTGNAFASDRRVEEYAVKAAFVLNFARYTQWSAECFDSPTEPFRLCVLGNKAIEPAFQALNEKKIGSRTLHVRFITMAKDTGQCHILFISEDIDRTTLLETLAAVRDKPVLTIGETKAFINSGGVINLFNRKGRLYFEINKTAARQQRLKLSSRLLKLAIIVGDK
jgi:hypothetical protein